MRIVGILLIVAGLLGLIYGGFNYTKQRTVLDVGPIEAKVDERKTVPIPPIAGGIAILAGVVLFIADRRRVSA